MKKPPESETEESKEDRAAGRKDALCPGERPLTGQYISSIDAVLSFGPAAQWQSCKDEQYRSEMIGRHSEATVWN